MHFIQRAAGLLLGFTLLGADAAPIELQANRWDANGEATFTRDAAHPHGVLSIRGGGAVLKDLIFRDGTIEYDIEEYADNQGIPGIWFHQQGTENAEDFYMRTDAGCPGSNECIQYAPVSHNNVEWDVYPEFQTSAPVKATGWNHVKLVISGRRMNVFINGEARPSLSVARLAGDPIEGKLQLRGDARFANLDVTPGATDGLPSAPLVTAADGDPRYLRQWQIAPTTNLTRGADVDYADRPAATLAWEPIEAEAKGMVNIGRHHGTAHGTPDLAWLKTTVHSGSIQKKHVTLGWAREIWVYVNGKLVFADRNNYYPAAARRPPQGRLALANGDLMLPLSAGDNTVEIAISNDMPSTRHWGWGFEFHFDDIDGLALPHPPAAM